MIIDTEDTQQIKEYESRRVDLIYEKKETGEYNSSDVVLVRATDHLPENNMVPAICNVPFITRVNSVQNTALRSLLKKREMERRGVSQLEYDEEVRITEMANQLTPLSTQYRSSVHFTLNGIVQNHAYGKFDGGIVIIEPFAPHEDDSNILSVRPDDTYFKDGVELSDEAAILVPIEMKDMVPSDGNYVFYKGDRNKAVKMYLTSIGIVHEDINTSYVEESKTSRMLLDFIQSKGYPNEAHRNHPNYTSDDSKNEELWMRYDERFYDYLSKTAFPDGSHEREIAFLKTAFKDFNYVFNPDYERVMCGVIEDIGIDNYCQIVSDFNEGLKREASTVGYPTNNEILGITPVEIPKHGNIR